MGGGRLREARKVARGDLLLLGGGLLPLLPIACIADSLDPKPLNSALLVIYTHAVTHAHTRAHVACTCTQMRIHVTVHMHMHTHACIHVTIHMHMHTHAYM
jgi:hypothetical protein